MYYDLTKGAAFLGAIICSRLDLFRPNNCELRFLGTKSWADATFHFARLRRGLEADQEEIVEPLTLRLVLRWARSFPTPARKKIRAPWEIGSMRGPVLAATLRRSSGVPIRLNMRLAFSVVLRAIPGLP
jgi:hypothetical protein